MTAMRRLLSTLLLLAACPGGDDGTSSSSTGESTAAPPTTTDTGASSTSGTAETAGTSTGTSSGDTDASDQLCQAYAEQFVECFPDEEVGVDAVRAQCLTDLASDLGPACIDALEAFFACYSDVPCEDYDVACSLEIADRMEACGG